jgi:hypothetical protein
LKRLFREGGIAMLDELEPEVVLAYGSMPDKIFHGLQDKVYLISRLDYANEK